MANHSHASGADEPENRRKGRRPKTQRNGNDKQCGVHLRRRRTPAANLEIIALELANSIHTSHHQADDKKEHQVGEQAVDAEHDEHGGIVAREVAQVVVDSALHFAEIGRLRDALDIEKLADGSQVGEARRHRRGAQTVEAAAKVHSRRERIDGDAEARHDGCVARGWLRVGWRCLLDVVGGNESLSLGLEICGRGHY